MFHSAVLVELMHHGIDRGSLLADGDIDTFNTRAPLIDDGIDSQRGLAGLAVADDELTLAASDRHHGIDGFKSSLDRLAHREPGDHAGGDLLQGRGFRGGYRPL